MNPEWPIGGSGRSEAPWPVRARAARLRDATADLFTAPGDRLPDRVRASVSAMRDAVVGAVERDMRLHLLNSISSPPELVASLGAASVAIARPLLRDAEVLRDPAFNAVLLRRAAQAAEGRRIEASGAADRSPFVDDEDPAISAAAMALLIAHSRRLDRFGEPTLLFDDLPAETAHWLVWRVAAALRHYLRFRHGVAEGEADALITDAAAAILAGHDEGRGLDATAARLAARLAAAGRADGDALATLAAAGDVHAFVALLAVVTRIPAPDVWDVIEDRSASGLALLLRAAEIEREEAAAILLGLSASADEAAAQIEIFDRHGESASRAAASLALPPEYRAAISSIDTALAAAGAQ